MDSLHSWLDLVLVDFHNNHKCLVFCQFHPWLGDQGTLMRALWLNCSHLGCLPEDSASGDAVPGASKEPLICTFLCWWLWLPFLFTVKAFALILVGEKVENPALFLVPFWWPQHWSALCREWQVMQWAGFSIMLVKCWKVSERAAVRIEWMHAECLDQCPVYCKWPGDVGCRLFSKLAHSGSGAMS